MFVCEKHNGLVKNKQTHNNNSNNNNNNTRMSCVSICISLRNAVVVKKKKKSVSFTFVFGLRNCAVVNRYMSRTVHVSVFELRSYVPKICLLYITCLAFSPQVLFIFLSFFIFFFFKTTTTCFPVHFASLWCKHLANVSWISHLHEILNVFKSLFFSK